MLIGRIKSKPFSFQRTLGQCCSQPPLPQEPLRWFLVLVEVIDNEYVVVWFHGFAVSLCLYA